MMNKEQQIPCPMPDCNGHIIFDTYKLLEGAKFTCPDCKASIGIAAESKEEVEDAMTKFEKMKKKLARMKQNSTN